MAAKTIQKVLVIKLGGIGEVVLAFPAFERIRLAHPKAKTTLLTTEPYAALAAASPYFNTVEADGAAKDPASWTALIMRIRRAHYDRVYDLQNDGVSSLIFQGLRPLPPPWSGTALGCSLPHRNRQRGQMHQLERQADQLKDAGIWDDAPTKPLSAAERPAAVDHRRRRSPSSGAARAGRRRRAPLADRALRRLRPPNDRRRP
jgi:ADP-heptose:LPS heptosyltransferase